MGIFMSITRSSPVSMENLPDENLIKIFSYLLEDKHLNTLACVSRSMNRLSSDNQLWKIKTEDKFGPMGAYQPYKIWKEVHKELFLRQMQKNRGFQPHDIIQPDDLRSRFFRAVASLFGWKLDVQDDRLSRFGWKLDVQDDRLSRTEPSQCMTLSLPKIT